MFYGVFYTGLEAVGGTVEKGSHHLERLLNILYTLLHLTLPETLWGRFHQHLNFTGGEVQIWRGCLGCKATRPGRGRACIWVCDFSADHSQKRELVDACLLLRDL